jgi:hypothetical protein
LGRSEVRHVDLAHPEDDVQDHLVDYVQDHLEAYFLEDDVQDHLGDY